MTYSISHLKGAVIGFTFAALAGCAVVHSPARLTPVMSVSPAQTLGRQLDIVLDTGYSRTVKAGSQWQLVGNIIQGTVYRPLRDVFTLEGAHIHEAYLVVGNGKLVGFYLPAEGGFSPLKHPLEISLQ